MDHFTYNIIANSIMAGTAGHAFFFLSSAWKPLQIISIILLNYVTFELDEVCLKEKVDLQ